MNEIFLDKFNSNETEINFFVELSSSNVDYIVIKHFMANNNSSEVIEKANDINPIEDARIKYKAKIQQDILDKKIEQLTMDLVMLLKFFDSSEGINLEVSKKIWDIQEKYTFRVLGEVLQNIYVEYNDYPNMLIGICEGLGMFELEEVQPWGPTMISGLLGHKDARVKEYAISVVENWSDTAMLPILRNINCKDKWLQDYIQNVINYLEDYYNEIE